jgi:hypothetical protein
MALERPNPTANYAPEKSKELGTWIVPDPAMRVSSSSIPTEGLSKEERSKGVMSVEVDSNVDPSVCSGS